MMAGLLDFASLYGDPSSAGLLGTAAGLLKAGGPSPYPTSFGQAMGQGFLTGFGLWNEADQAKRRTEFINAQVAHMGAQTRSLEAERAFKEAGQAFLNAPYTAQQPQFDTAPRVTLAGGMSVPGGGQANFRTGEYSAPQAAAPQVDPRLLDPNWVMQAKRYGFDVTDLHKQYTTPQQRVAGSTYVNPVDRSQTYYPQLRPGETMVNGRVVNVPGAVSSQVESATAMGEVTSAADRARATAERLKNWYETGQWQDLPWELQRPGQAPGAAPGPQTATGAPPGPPRPAPGPAAPPGPAQGAPGPMVTTSTVVDPREVGARPSNIVPKEWNERLSKQPEVAARLNQVYEQYARLRGEAEGLINHPGLPGIYGVSGAFPDFPGRSAANARVKMKAFTDQIASNTLQTLRDMSKTGGALGQVSDRDIDLMRNQLGSLDKAQNVEQAKEVLRKIIKFTETSQNNLLGAYDATYNIQRMRPNAPAPIVPPGRRLPGGPGDLRWGDLTGGR